MRTNWLQLEMRIGTLTGPPGASPTNAATAVPTPSIGFFPLETSSTYTPGVRYVGMLLLRPSYALTGMDAWTGSRGAPSALARTAHDHVHSGAGHGDLRLGLVAGR